MKKQSRRPQLRNPAPPTLERLLRRGIADFRSKVRSLQRAPGWGVAAMSEAGADVEVLG